MQKAVISSCIIGVDTHFFYICCCDLFFNINLRKLLANFLAIMLNLSVAPLADN